MSEPNRSQPHQQRVQTHFGGEPAYEDVERHPLVDAVRDGRRNDVAYILTGGTTPDVGNNRIGTPLYWAAERGHREIALNCLLTPVPMSMQQPLTVGLRYTLPQRGRSPSC